MFMARFYFLLPLFLLLQRFNCDLVSAGLESKRVLHRRHGVPLLVARVVCPDKPQQTTRLLQLLLLWDPYRGEWLEQLAPRCLRHVDCRRVGFGYQHIQQQLADQAVLALSPDADFVCCSVGILEGLEPIAFRDLTGCMVQAHRLVCPIVTMDPHTQLLSHQVDLTQHHFFAVVAVHR
jgi:hypothetical protein